MASKSSVLLFGPQGLINLCAHARRVQVSARAFQLLARRATSDREFLVRRNSLRWLHTTRRSTQQSAVEINSVDVHKYNRVDLEQDKRARQRERSKAEHHRNVSSPETVDSSKTETSDVNSHSGIGTGHKEGRPFHKPTGRHSFREYMRKVCHPVAIVTSADTSIDPEGGPKTWRGATVSSFNSVTLQPHPYVSFNIKKLSSTYDAIRHSKHFTVNVMGKTAGSVVIATHFSQGNGAEPFFQKPSLEAQAEQPETEPVLHPFVQKTPRWFDIVDKSSLPPIIQFFNSPHRRGVLFHSLCEFQPEMSTEVGDHVIVIGKVLRSLGNLDAHTELDQYNLGDIPQCLTYVDGRYRCKVSSDPEKWWKLGHDLVDSTDVVRKIEPKKSATEYDFKINKVSRLPIRHTPS